MKWGYLSGTLGANSAQLKEAFKEPTFVIGVKNTTFCLDVFLNARPNLKIIKAMKPVPNTKYLDAKSSHMLQPAIIQWKD